MVRAFTFPFSSVSFFLISSENDISISSVLVKICSVHDLREYEESLIGHNLRGTENQR